MAILRVLVVLSAASSALGSPFMDLAKRAACPTKGMVYSAKNCIYSGGTDFATSYCSSYLGITTVTKTKVKSVIASTQTIATVTTTAPLITSVVTLTSTVLTCPNNAHFTWGANMKDKRQATSSAPSCLTAYGASQISPACQSCVAPQTPTATVTVTTTANDQVTGTVTITPTSVVTTTTTVTSASSTPANFYVYYTDSASSTRYASIIPAPEGTPRVVAFPSSTPGTAFNLNNVNAVFDKQPEDIYPWIYLDTTGTAGYPLICSACTNLTCNYIGESNDVFAVCDSYLALGLVGNFTGRSDCVQVTLGVQNATSSA